jgi:hypothetical protein
MAALALTLAALVAGCGGGGSSTTATSASGAPTTGTATKVDEPRPALSPEESADAEILNNVLGRQEAVAAAYAKLLPDLAPKPRRMVAYFRAQEQEHVDGLVKAMRGLRKVPAEPEAEEVAVPAAKTDAEWLHFVYEVESVSIDDELSAISNLETGWPRSLLASVVANQAQHLTLLRQALGAGPLASVPTPFENGTAEAPAAPR